MNEKMRYFPDEDILHVLIRPGHNPDGLLLGSGTYRRRGRGTCRHNASFEGGEAGSVELSPHVTAELDENGEIIGIEITDATAYVRDNILESAQARMHGRASRDSD